MKQLAQAHRVSNCWNKILCYQTLSISHADIIILILKTLLNIHYTLILVYQENNGGDFNKTIELLKFKKIPSISGGEMQLSYYLQKMTARRILTKSPPTFLY